MNAFSHHLMTLHRAVTFTTLPMFRIPCNYLRCMTLHRAVTFTTLPMFRIPCNYLRCMITAVNLAPAQTPAWRTRTVRRGHRSDAASSTLTSLSHVTNMSPQPSISTSASSIPAVATRAGTANACAPPSRRMHISVTKTGYRSSGGLRSSVVSSQLTTYQFTNLLSSFA